LVGLWKKKYIGLLMGKDVSKESLRVLGTAAGVTASVAGGADVVRVHNVEVMVNFVKNRTELCLMSL
jgi:dihydropteroate synthase